MVQRRVGGGAAQDEAKAKWQEKVEVEDNFSLQVRSLRGGSSAEAFILSMRWAPCPHTLP